MLTWQQTVVKMALSKLDNLAVLAGDAKLVLSRRVPTESLSQVVYLHLPPSWQVTWSRC